MKTTFLLGGAAIALLVSAASGARAGEVLDRVHAAGAVHCGLVREEAEYGKEDTHGNIAALGLDLCRAVAAGVLGDATKIAIVGVPDVLHGIHAVQEGRADLLIGATPDFTTATAFHLAFGPPVFIDGQGFLVPKAASIATVADLAGKPVCYIDETDMASVLTETFARRGIKHIAFPFQERGEMEAALTAGHCTAITADVSDLASMRAEFHAWVDRFTILPEQISRDPVAPAYQTGDAQWSAIVDWTVYALLQAEALGITSSNASEMAKSDLPSVRRLLGSTPGMGRALGLDADWAQRAIRAVGNYGEMFERDLGAQSDLMLPRGENRLASQGGLLYAMPMR